MSTGYISLALTKEAGTPALPIPENQWTAVKFDGAGPLYTLPEGPCLINAQLYFENIVGSKIAVRVMRGSGDDTAQQDYRVLSGPWAVSYMDLDFPKPPDLRRGIEVWADKPCVLQTRILKVENPAAYIAARTSPTAED